MGLYYKNEKKDIKGKVGIAIMAISALIFLILILPFLKPVAMVFYGLFGLTIYPIIILMQLVGLALKLGKSFALSTKNVVYLVVTSVLLVLMLHTIFLSRAILSYGKITMARYFDFLCKVANGTLGLTVGGFIFTIVCYPFISLLGVVGATITFAIALVIFVGLTVDYYVNLKSFYDKSRARRATISRDSLSSFSGDSLESSLMNNTKVDLTERKESKVYYGAEEESIIETGEEFNNDLNLTNYTTYDDNETTEDPIYGNLFNPSNIDTSSYDEDNLSNDELAKSNFNSGKFKSAEEYIKYPYVPSFFNNKIENDEESETSDDFGFNNSPRESSVNEESLTTDRYDYIEPASPFNVNQLDNDFSESVRSNRFEENKEENISPFASSFTESRERSIEPERTRRAVEENTVTNFGITPKLSDEQLSMPGVRQKPKTYKLEQDAKYNAPPTSILVKREDDPSQYGQDYEEKSRALENILSSFKIDAKVSGVTRGPSVTQYELTMPFGISVKRVLQYDGDIAAALRSKKGIRIEAPIAGKNAVGVEVPNDNPSTVGMRELLESNDFKNSKQVLPFVVGKNISGETIIKSLPKMVHMLVAGSTGSGKSVFLHSVIVSLMYKCSPSQLRFILIDPKRVEFTIYSGMPHMMLPNAVSNCEKAINALSWAVKEMERRFDSFQTLSVQNIEDYNHCEQVKNGEYPKIPYIIIVIDELNELMMTGKKDVEEKITRLSQLGRASGIHMIIATQRPSTDVVTGTIKNNLPTRVAFALQSGIDSRVILDETGAEKLLGRGDMLLAPYDDNVTSRVQGSFMSMDEVRKVVQYIKDNNESYFDEAVAKEILADKTPPPQEEGSSSIAGNLEPDDDELLPAALKLCIDTGGASINMVQRRFRVGYARAARIIDQLELKGYISPGNGSKLRTVHISLDEYHQKFGEDQ